MQQLHFLYGGVENDDTHAAQFANIVDLGAVDAELNQGIAGQKRIGGGQALVEIHLHVVQTHQSL